MSFQLKISGGKTLEIKYTGTVTKEEVDAVRENAIAMINSNDLNRVFCDTREANLDISPVDLFNFAASQKKVYPVIRRAAILCSDNYEFTKDLDLCVKTATRRGFKLKVFCDLNECKTWLNS